VWREGRRRRMWERMALAWDGVLESDMVLKDEPEEPGDRVLREDLGDRLLREALSVVFGGATRTAVLGGEGERLPLLRPETGGEREAVTVTSVVSGVSGVRVIFAATFWTS